MTGSSPTLPGVGRSLSGQLRARVLQRTPSCNTCSLRSESSSHRKAPVASTCPGQGGWSRKNKMEWGKEKAGHSRVSRCYLPQVHIFTHTNS